MTTRTPPSQIKPTDAVMVGACTECGDTILHGEGWAELRTITSATMAAGTFRFFASHHHACKARQS